MKIRTSNIIYRLIEISVFLLGFSLVDDFVLKFLYNGKVGRYDEGKYEFDLVFVSILYLLLIFTYYAFLFSYKSLEKRYTVNDEELVWVNKSIIIARCAGIVFFSISFLSTITLTISAGALVIGVSVLISLLPYLLFKGLSNIYTLKHVGKFLLLMGGCLAIVYVLKMIGINVGQGLAPVVAAVAGFFMDGSEINAAYTDSLTSRPDNYKD